MHWNSELVILQLSVPPLLLDLQTLLSSSISHLFFGEDEQ